MLLHKERSRAKCQRFLPRWPLSELRAYESQDIRRSNERFGFSDVEKRPRTRRPDKEKIGGERGVGNDVFSDGGLVDRNAN